jgi:hypothetical protein
MRFTSDCATLISPYEGIVGENVGTKHAVPLAPCQEWYLEYLRCHEHLPPGNALDNTVTAVRVGGQVSEAAFSATAELISRRHEALRLTVRTRGADVDQEITAPPVPAEVVDVSGAANPAAEAVRQVNVEQFTRIDIDRGPVFQPKLYRIGPDDHVLMVKLHHFVVDPPAFGTIWREFGEGMAGHGAGDPAPSFREFAMERRRRMSGPTLDRHLDFWSRQLSGVAPRVIPADVPRGQVEHYRQGHLAFELSEVVGQALTGLCVQHRVTPYMALLAAYQILLLRWTPAAGPSEVIVASPFGGHVEPDEQGLVANLLSRVFIRGDLSGDPAFADVLEGAREASLHAYDHRGVPFRAMVDRLRPDWDWAVPFDAKALYHGNLDLVQRPSPVRLPGLSATRVPLDRMTRHFELPGHDGARRLWQNQNPALNLAQWGDLVGGEIVYNAAVFSRTRVQALADDFLAICATCFADPSTRLSALRVPSTSTVGFGDRIPT